jgi:hypothetical protein
MDVMAGVEVIVPIVAKLRRLRPRRGKVDRAPHHRSIEKRYRGNAEQPSQSPPPQRRCAFKHSLTMQEISIKEKVLYRCPIFSTPQREPQSIGVASRAPAAHKNRADGVAHGGGC